MLIDLVTRRIRISDLAKFERLGGRVTKLAVLKEGSIGTGKNDFAEVSATISMLMCSEKQEEKIFDLCKKFSRINYDK